MKNKLNQSLGNYIAHFPIENGLQFETTLGKFQLIVYQHSIIRLRIVKEDFEERDFSYSVIAKPEPLSFLMEENGNSFRLITNTLTLQISKNPMRFSFFTKEGKLINQDDAAFGTSWIGEQVTTYKILQEGEHFIGLGEKTGNLDRRGRAFTHWNTDRFGYDEDSDMIYASFPFYIGINQNLAYGIFMDNSYKSHFNFGASNDRFVSFCAEDGEMNYYFIHNESVSKIIEDYTFLTGRMEMPPLWSLGYQQCRYSYYPESEVLTLARTFREKQIPADVIYLDIHYMQDYKLFTWDEKRFPEPEKLIKKLEEMGFKVVVMCDPGIKVEKGYKPYDKAIKKDLFVKYPDGTPYTAQVWPGWCHFPDFTKEETRAWWGESFKEYVSMGLEGFWNDMNEPASWGQRTPDLIEFDMDGEKASFKRVHNLYGMQMTRATFEGTKKLLKGRRPFLLTRSAFCGSQRFTAIWTGDNTSSDEHMMTGIRLVNALGLSGMPVAGYDVGGFIGEPSVALFARWLSIGAFSAFFRGHSMINSKDQEPWSYGEEVEDIARNYISLRYKLLPYIYSYFYEATRNGLPVVRSLAIDYTFDENIYSPKFQNQYLFGANLLVCPVESYKEITKVYLPKGAWYYLYSNTLYQGGEEIYADCPLELLPVYVKAGGILLMQSLVQSTGEKHDGILEVHVYYGTEGSTFIYYEDDGKTYKYEKGKYYKRNISYFPENQAIVFSMVEGDYKSSFDKIKLVLHNFEGVKKNIEVNNEKVKVIKEELELLPPVSSFDPLGKQNTSIKQINKVALFENSDKEIIVRLS
ncbi:glycoside hydrolase family 31 protein [Thermoflexibacter ruber]|uniref:Alpha-glucosidase n=1 Tax=Thermoflexibacter ruber TaxID=1003 RepID=A0A1I2IB56_9BACT|nr:TIM-barrel domain-containing protein [Thermoflexibacter ruber]SFF38898.1 alpha-glucosidase [Thermoflexibacter ruber]